ncbi:MAG: hypothetical protein ACE5Z5_08425 [Candidatus Bathyarchaeia archaeon]
MGDLEMTWQKKPQEKVEKELYELWEGYKSMTLTGWRGLLEETGFVDVRTVDFSDAIPDMEKALMKELGAYGMLKFGVKLMFNPSVRKAMNEYRRVFKQYVDYIGYGYFVGRKPLQLDRQNVLKKGVLDKL